jgi:hypothetical protein
MGVDLTLLPDKHPGIGFDSSYDRLGLQGRNYDLWDRLKAVATPLPAGLQWYGDEGLHRVTENPYGEPITFVSVSLFLKLWDECNPAPCEWDRAVAAFLRALPVDRRVILWFH